MAIQHEIEALIVDTPIICLLQIIGAKPSSKKQRKDHAPSPCFSSQNRYPRVSQRGMTKKNQNKQRKS
jgi:hypothetical protein